jgi:hypothetical protein
VERLTTLGTRAASRFNQMSSALTGRENPSSGPSWVMVKEPGLSAMDTLSSAFSAMEALRAES